MNKTSRRNFVMKYTLLSGVALFPGWIIQGCSAHKTALHINGLSSAPIVVDKETWFINNLANKEYRPMPDDPQFRYFSGFPAIQNVQPVPFLWGKENFYSGNGGYITDNVYLEPGKPWVLQLAISTPGVGDTSTGSVQYKIWYRTSANGGKTFSDLKQVIIEGYTSMKPITGVEIGRNGFNVDFTRPIVRASNGEIMIPVGTGRWDEEKGKIYSPVSGAGLFGDAGVLIANWLPDGTDIEWKFGEWNHIDYNLSTRGLSEPTIVETRKPGRFAMVTRCSNSARPELPGYAWVSFSDDYCRSWSVFKPFTYADGGNFFVPTSHSTLFKSRKTRRVYWIGNLNETNPNGSHPRYPLAIGEVDLESFGLIRETVTIIDTRHPEVEGPLVQLSNFKVMENVVANEILVVCTRIEGTSHASHPSWYRIKL
ncbi:MAG: sialidase family protein [Bacteroidia bacterium]|nr:sialidase family protein [Bacteroidia bacterium]